MALIFVYLVLESSLFLGLILPGEVIIVFAGALAGQGILTPAGVFAVVISSTIIGDASGYLIGAHYGTALIAKSAWLRGRYQRYGKRLEVHLQNWGFLTILIARISGMLQAFLPFICGISGYPLTRFLALIVIAECVWSGGLCGAGYLLGRNWKVMMGWLGSIGDLFIVLIIASIGIFALRELIQLHWRSS